MGQAGLLLGVGGKIRGVRYRTCFSPKKIFRFCSGEVVSVDKFLFNRKRTCEKPTSSFKIN
jgi:hypothetical protein